MAASSEADQVERQRIREVVQNWALWRDAGDWERFRTVWHSEARMMATWFQGPADKFIAVSREAWNKGVSILHFLGGSAIDLAGTRAIAQTKMTISQRAAVDGVVCDVLCTGRFYDFFERREGEWRIVLRQPIYEKDRLDPVDPAAALKLDASLLAQFPEGYRQGNQGLDKYCPGSILSPPWTAPPPAQTSTKAGPSSRSAASAGCLAE